MTEKQILSSINPSLDFPIEASKMNLKWQRIARIAWIIVAMIAVIILIASLPGYWARWQGEISHISVSGNQPGIRIFAIAGGIASLSSALLSISLAFLLFRRKFSEPIAILVSFFLMIYGIVMAGPLEHLEVFLPGVREFAFILQGILFATPLFALLMLFPNGKFVPSWTRWVVILSIPWNIGLILIAPFDSVSLTQTPIVTSLVVIFLILFTLAGIYAQIYRYRKISSPSERQQTRWVVFGFTVWIIYSLLATIPFMYLNNLPTGSIIPWWGPVSELGWWLSLTILPIFLTIAITKSRLWNIDIVINRTLVYGALTFTTITIYILIVGALGNLLNIGNRSLIAFFATGLVAVLFQPLRVRLQNGVNRLMYGERDNPVAVLSKLGETLENTGSPEDALSGITKTVATTLKLPYVAIELGENKEITAAYGIPKNHLIRLPMQYQNTTSGYLVVAQRSPNETFQPLEMQLLENIARQAGAAAHAAKLTADLLASRQQLVSTREEERRRIRRDLHDGLGPQLASQALTLTAARRLLSQDPVSADQLIQEAIKHAQTSTEDLRRLVYDLRPPALDDLGLLDAMKIRVQHFQTEKLTIDLDLPDSLPQQLPAAVEVAVYMIFQEALTNVVRHSGANNCLVSLKVNGKLELNITDTGSGINRQAQTGVGLNSMRQRAEELGGLFQVRSSPEKGTQLAITLPLSIQKGLL